MVDLDSDDTTRQSGLSSAAAPTVLRRVSDRWRAPCSRGPTSRRGRRERSKCTYWMRVVFSRRSTQLPTDCRTRVDQRYPPSRLAAGNAGGDGVRYTRVFTGTRLPPDDRRPGGCEFHFNSTDPLARTLPATVGLLLSTVISTTYVRSDRDRWSRLKRKKYKGCRTVP